jgi:hypothetical protein
MACFLASSCRRLKGKEGASRNCTCAHESEPRFACHAGASREKEFHSEALITSVCPQNYLNESLKYLDKAYPGGAGSGASLAGLSSSPSVSSSMIGPDTKPIYIDTKALLGHHMQSAADKK